MFSRDILASGASVKRVEHQPEILIPVAEMGVPKKCIRFWCSPQLSAHLGSPTQAKTNKTIARLPSFILPVRFASLRDTNFSWLLPDR